MSDLSNDQIHNFVLADVTEERERQDAKWGTDRDIRSVPEIPCDIGDVLIPTITELIGIPSEERAKRCCDENFRQGTGSWAHIAVEELAEAVEAKTDAERRAELVQLAAVVVAWIENLDRRARA